MVVVKACLIADEVVWLVITLTAAALGGGRGAGGDRHEPDPPLPSQQLSVTPRPHASNSNRGCNGPVTAASRSPNRFPNRRQPVRGRSGLWGAEGGVWCLDVQ